MISEDEIKQYLLNDLPVEEREAFEESFFLNDELFRRLEIVEMQLTDSFVRGEMSAADRKKFSEHFAVTPQRIAEIKRAELFHKNLQNFSEEIEPQFLQNVQTAKLSALSKGNLFERFRSFFGGNLFPLLSTATVLILLTFGFVRFFVIREGEDLAINSVNTNVEIPFNQTANNLPGNTAQTNGSAENSVRAGNNLPGRTNSPASNKNTDLPKENLQIPLPEMIVEAHLLPEKNGSDISTANPVKTAPAQVKIPKGAKKIILRLQLDSVSENGNFSAAILNSRGGKIQTFTDLKPRLIKSKKIISVEVLPDRLKNGTFAINMSDDKGNQTIYRFNTISQQ